MFVMVRLTARMKEVCDGETDCLYCVHEFVMETQIALLAKMKQLSFKGV